MSISPDVVIMTKAELEAFKQKWFQKGVERGRFEERMDRNSAMPERNRGATEAEGADVALKWE